MQAIINANVFDVRKGTIIENCTVLIRGGKIQAVGSGIPVPADTEITNAGSMYLLPGLIDAHCHLGLFEDGMGFEGDDGNEMTDPVTPELRAIDGINPMDRGFSEALAGGVTCVCTGPGSANVLGGQFATVKTWGNRIDDMIVQAPAAMKTAFGENPKRVYNDKKQAPMTRMSIAAKLRETLLLAGEYSRKKQVEDPEKQPGYHFKYEALLPVLSGELPVKAHAHRADDILTAIRIAKEFGLKLTLDHCTEGHLITEALLEAGYPVIVGPHLTTRSKIELKALDFKTPGILSGAGIKTAIMTDHPVIPIQHLNLCAALSVKAGMDEWEALRAITLNAAEILGISNRVGAIEPGMDADLVLWRGHPFAWDSEVQQVWVEGAKAYQV